MIITIDCTCAEGEHEIGINPNYDGPFEGEPLDCGRLVTAEEQAAVYQAIGEWDADVEGDS